MGSVLCWSSPYRLQVLVICLGLLLLTAAFVLLLLSIGLADFRWRLAGGVCASAGSALLVLGACWCVWVVRHGRFVAIGIATHTTRHTAVASASGADACEATQTLTSDTTWREEAGIDGPCSGDIDGELGPDCGDFDDDDDDDDDTDDDDDDEDSDDEDDEDDEDINDCDEEEEEEDCLGPEIYPIADNRRYNNRLPARTAVGRTELRTNHDTGLLRHGRNNTNNNGAIEEDESSVVETKEEESSRLIPV